jgi:hypothetical protein
MAYVAYRLLVSCGIPIRCLPFCGIEIAVGCGDQYSHVLRVERMPVTPAVARPEMVIVNLGSGQFAA